MAAVDWAVGERDARAYVESLGRQVNYCQSGERRIAPRIPDTLTVVGRRRREPGAGTLAARISGEGWKTATSLRPPLSFSCGGACLCSPPSPVIDSCQPSALESFTRTKVDIAALAALPSSPPTAARPLPDPSRPVLVSASSNSTIFFVSVSLCLFFSRIFLFFFSSLFFSFPFAPTFFSFNEHRCSLPLFSLNPFCHSAVRTCTYAYAHGYVSPVLLRFGFPFYRNRPLSFEFRAVSLVGFLYVSIRCLLELEESTFFL